ncbi:MAG: cation-efflux pump [Anaerolineales bacterium]|nr:cation transporter [Anaerolineae bacterium]PWB49590.1 MAG: cation-efflux pump [Anaerolineales bacterium]
MKTTNNNTDHSVPLTRYAWLSIAAAVVTITMKATAYYLTGSVGLLSDALESVVNLAAAIVALLVLRLVSHPANDEFTFGFSKAEYFASGFEGGMILVAAVGIIITAIPRLINPVPLENLGWGLLVSVTASLINLAVSLILMRAARRHNSITLEADAKHLMTDVWTTGGVLVGIALVWLTGFVRLDPIIALIVAANIIFTGYRLLVRSGRGLLDVSIPQEEIGSVKSILDSYKEQGVAYHALRSRQAAARKFMVVHLLVPGNWSVTRAHSLAEKIENQVMTAVENANIVTHVEPIEDPLSMKDTSIDRNL